MSEFKLQSCYYIHFQTNTFSERHEPPYPSMLDYNIIVIEFKTPVVLLYSLTDKYPWERHEPSYLLSYGLNSTSTVLICLINKTVIVQDCFVGKFHFCIVYQLIRRFVFVFLNKHLRLSFYCYLVHTESTLTFCYLIESHLLAVVITHIAIKSKPNQINKGN